MNNKIRMKTNLIIDILFLLHRPLWGFNSNIKANISKEDKIYYLRTWIIGDILIAIIFFVISLFL